MQRRAFLALVSCLPFVSKLWPAAASKPVWRAVTREVIEDGRASIQRGDLVCYNDVTETYYKLHEQARDPVAGVACFDAEPGETVWILPSNTRQFVRDIGGPLGYDI